MEKWIAEKSDRTKITIEDDEKAYEEVREIKQKYILEKLGEHHRLIYEFVKKNPKITSSELVTEYRSECERIGLGSKSPRTLSSYLNKLVALKHIKSERASVRGNVRKFRVV